MKRISLWLLAVVLIFSGCASQNPVVLENSTAKLPIEATSASLVSEKQEDSTSSQNTSNVAAVTLPEDVVVILNNIRIEIDPMMEMLSIIQYLSEYSGLTKLKTSYKEDIDAAFGRYSEHEAVKFFREAMGRGFHFDRPPSACLYLEKDFSISEGYEDSDFAKYFMGEDMGLFRDVMEQFCRDTNFNEFFGAHNEFYRQMSAAYTKEFPQWDMISAIEDYFGKSMAGYHIVLVPLFHSGGYSSSVQRAGGRQLYSIIGPAKTDGNLPLFGDEAGITDLVVHEFGHSFVPIGDFYHDAAMQAEVERSEYLMKAVGEQMKALNYNQWLTAYEELVLRAVTIDIIMKNSDSSLENALWVERNQGFIYIDDVYQIIKKYSENRAQYPVFDSFIPVITDYLLERYPK